MNNLLFSAIKRRPVLFRHHSENIPRRAHYSKISNEQILQDIAEELNNIAVNLYEENDFTFAIDVFKDAANSLMETAIPTIKTSISIEEKRSELIQKIILSKKRLYDITSSSKKMPRDGLDKYQWSDIDSNSSPKCLSEGIKINNGDFPKSKNLIVSTIIYNTALVHLKSGLLGVAKECFELVMKACNPDNRSNMFSSCNRWCNEAPYEALVFAAALNNLAYIHYRSGNLLEAKKKIIKALQITKKAMTSSKDHMQKYKYIGTMLFNIGVINVVLGLKDEVVKPLRRCLAYQKMVLGEYHPDIAIIEHNIGMAFGEIEMWENAINCFLESLRIIRFKFGNEHHFAAKELFHIGKVHEMKGDIDAALHAYDETLRIEKKTLGLYNYETFMTMCDIGQVYHRKENLNEALRFYNDALVVAEAVDDSDCKAILFVLQRILIVQFECGDTAAAIQTQNKIINVMESGGNDHNINKSVEYVQMEFLLANPPAAAAA